MFIMIDLICWFAIGAIGVLVIGMITLNHEHKKWTKDMITVEKKFYYNEERKEWEYR